MIKDSIKQFFLRLLNGPKRNLWTARISVVIAVAAAVGFGLYQYYYLPKQQKVVPWSVGRDRTETPPADRAWIGASAPHLSLGQDGVIMLSSLDEPAIELSSYNVSGDAEIAFYEANENLLLRFLVHDKDNKQINPEVNVRSLRLIATTTHPLESRGEANKLALPIEENGILLVRAKARSEDKKTSISKDFFVVRSHFAVLAKEAQQELVFWGQSFKDSRSIPAGTVKIYNLADRAAVIETSQFDAGGIARAKLTGEGDIALSFYDNSISAVPLNTRYLDSGWGGYRVFRDFQLHEKLFVFTDRPLYRPGDTVFFKAVLRDDNDAQYSVPAGRAEAAVWSGWDSKEPLFKKEFSVSPQGTVSGEFALPKDASTGRNYRLVVNLLPKRERQNEWFWDEGGSGATATFQVEYFRKPEYGLDLTVAQDQYVAGDKATFTVSGSYFSGQPLADRTVKYFVYASDFYDYGDYWSGREPLNDDYRYGYWRSATVKEGEVKLDQNGRAQVTIETSASANPLRDKVFSFEVVYEGETGNPSFARKNILVHRGQYGIYREDNDSFRGDNAVGTTYQLPVALVSRKGQGREAVQLTADIKRKEWIRYYTDESKYPHYREETETFPSLKHRTDNSGRAVFSFIPEKAGWYTMMVSGEDSAGNKISKEFSAWIRDESVPFYSETSDRAALTLQTNKDKYQPTETATLFISSTVPDRDVFVSLERGYMHRFEVVRIDGSLASVEIPLQESDMPNIFAQVSGFSERGYDVVSDNLIVSAEGKRLTVDIAADRQKYGPGETATLTVRTSDANGFPVSAETAVWAVDKALFELADEKPQDIYKTFWSERSNNTQEAHSLQGISVLTAEMGGCFGEDTPILMKDKTTKPIKEVSVGDVVLTKKDANTNELVEAKVIAKQEHKVPGYLIINGHLRVTPVHILNVNGEWKEAGSIQVGDLLINQDSQSVLVTSVEWQLGDFTVYNLKIEKYHTFIAGGIWVHNDKGNGGGARSVFKDTAYWNPRVHTDEAGIAQLRFTLPDNLTTWVVSSLGSTVDTKVGTARREITVSKDIIVRPILPNVLRAGDSLFLSSLVQNFTNRDHEFKTKLEFDAGDVQLTRPGNRFVNAGGTEPEYWRVEPKKAKTEAVLTFSAQATDDRNASDKVIQKLPVKPLGFVDRRAEIGLDSHDFNIRLAEGNNTKETRITLSLAPSVLGTLPEAIKYLVDYPYGCVEQTTSRLVPSIIARSEPELFAEALAGKDIKAIIEKGLERLSQLQNEDGGWGWWHGNSEPFVTLYVVEYLKLADDLGFRVNPTILSRAQNFFKQKIQNDAEAYRKQDSAGYISTMYALSLLGSDKAIVVSLEDISVTADLLAMAVMTNIRLGNRNPDTNGLNRLIGEAKEQGSLTYWEGGSGNRFGSKDASTALALRALIAGGTSRDIMVKAAQYLATNRQHGYWSNTFGTAQAMRAIAAYSRFAQETGSDYAYSVLLDGQEVVSGRVTSFRQKITNLNFSGSAIKPGGSTLAITKEGEGKLYSTLVIEEFRTDLENAAVSNGLSISRAYENETRPGWPFRVGDTVKVKLTVEGFADSEQYAVIEDELPAGLIPINESFKNEQYNDDDQWWYGREVTENGMVLSLSWASSKNEVYEYRARVVSEGRFMAPPAKVEMMYAPAVFARSPFYEFKTGQFLDD